MANPMLEAAASYLERIGMQVLDVDIDMDEDHADVIAYDPVKHGRTHEGMGALAFVQVLQPGDVQLTRLQLERMVCYYALHLRWDEQHFLIPVRSYRYDILIPRPMSDENRTQLFDYTRCVMPIDFS